MHNKTFRLFISSTFSDFTGEREALQTKVFPQLEAYCASYGYQFQAIDLRWGVNEEAQLDQKTIEICLNEVHTCKHYPHPNFLIMLGDRYGWVPLPYAIEKMEFESILAFYSKSEKNRALLQKWYQHDKNHFIASNSTAYVLNPRTENYIEFEHWDKVENQLRNLLQNAASESKFINNNKKYFISATEHEVIEGMYPYRKYSDINIESEKKDNSAYQLDMEYVYGFIREINRKNNNFGPSVFFDESEQRLPLFKSNLKKTLVKKNLLELRTDMITANKIETGYLDAFRDRILKYLKSSVAQQIKRIADGSAVDKIKSEHLHFKQERVKIFVGRSEVLRKIQEYVDSSSSIPLVIYAKSGMGKTSLIAKAIDKAGKNKSFKLIYRFVGATEKSSKIRSLLVSIIREIDKEAAKALNVIFNDESFNDNVEKFFSSIKNPTVIFIDALDQLQEKSYLSWLPDKLPKGLKIIFSVLEDELYKTDSGYLDLLKVKFKEKEHPNNFIALKPLGRKDGDKILSKLLLKESRSVTSDQRKYVLNKFESSDYSPLYLIVAFEEIKKWKSFDPGFDKTLENDVIESIKTFINDLSTVYHHQKFLVSRTLGYLECAKNGMSEKEMLDVLSQDNEVMAVIENQFHKNLSNKIPIAPWARLYSHLSPFLIERMSDNVSLLALFHRQFKNAIRTEILNDVSIEKELHQNLAQYFKQQPLVSSTGVYNLRKLSEQAFQFYRSDQPAELINLFEQDYINIKFKTDRFYDCLYEIDHTYLLIDKTKNNEEDNKNRLIRSLLKFLDAYSQAYEELFDYELIHTYFIYRIRSKFYPDFLKHVSDKKYIKNCFSSDKFVDDYYLRFLSGSVGLLRRTSNLNEAAEYVNLLIKEHRKNLKTKKNNKAIKKELSSTYYELGYILFFKG
jgi:hypothetical protein